MKFIFTCWHIEKKYFRTNLLFQKVSFFDNHAVVYHRYVLFRFGFLRRQFSSEFGVYGKCTALKVYIGTLGEVQFLFRFCKHGCTVVKKSSCDGTYTRFLPKLLLLTPNKMRRTRTFPTHTGPQKPELVWKHFQWMVIDIFMMYLWISSDASFSHERGANIWWPLGWRVRIISQEISICSGYSRAAGHGSGLLTSRSHGHARAAGHSSRGGVVSRSICLPAGLWVKSSFRVVQQSSLP